MLEACLRYIWDMLKIYVYVWDINKIYTWDILRYGWYVFKICLREEPIMCMRNSWDNPDICLRFARELPEICLRFAWDMPKICLRFAWDMPEIWLRFAKVFPEVYLWYAWNMCQISILPDSVSEWMTGLVLEMLTHLKTYMLEIS